MRKLTKTQKNLLTILSNGAYYTGNTLGHLIGISRTGVWKQIKNLQQLGVPLVSSKSKGYRLTAPLQLLNETAIQTNLKRLGFIEPLHFYFFASLPSTNRFLKETQATRTIEICCTEVQTEGRGRFGRTWYSPFGENIYCSTRWHFNWDLSALSGLSLVVSLAVITALADFKLHEELKIKWPNDILWQGKKLCGCLIELNAEINGGAEAIIGIGLNVNSRTELTSLEDKPWCSLYDITGQDWDRNDVLTRILVRLNEYLNQFTHCGFSVFLAEWRTWDYLEGRTIKVLHPGGHLVGTAHGVTKTGQLLLIDEAGEEHCLSSGDTSLKMS